MPRQSKYAEMAEKLYEKAGLNINARCENRLNKITSFLRSNYKKANNAVVFTNPNKTESMKKFKLVGKTNARGSGDSSTNVYVGIK